MPTNDGRIITLPDPPGPHLGDSSSRRGTRPLRHIVCTYASHNAISCEEQQAVMVMHVQHILNIVIAPETRPTLAGAASTLHPSRSVGPQIQTCATCSSLAYSISRWTCVHAGELAGWRCGGKGMCIFICMCVLLEVCASCLTYAVCGR